MKKIPLYIITGFLGSGKTTLIKKIINEYSSSHKIAIIENEFAPQNVDAIELKSMNKSFELMEVNKGSVFCVCLLNDFISSLNKFIESTLPDMIFLEATGLADPISIAELLESPLLSEKIFLAKVFSVVDANNYNKLKKNSRVTNQIRIADEVIINKTDLNSDNIAGIYESIRQINPYATIIKTKYCDIDLSILLKFQTDLVQRHIDDLDFNKNSGRPNIEVKVLKIGRRINSDAIQLVFNNLDRDIYRVKGYILTDNNRCLAVQYTFGQFEIKYLDNYSGNSILIGMGIKNSVSSMFKAILPLAA